VQAPPSLRYRRTMTKSPRKIVLRKETLRLLATNELSRAMGGGTSLDAAQLDGGSGDKGCIVAALPLK
jgi:hypothetical protein